MESKSIKNYETLETGGRKSKIILQPIIERTKNIIELEKPRNANENNAS